MNKILFPTLFLFNCILSAKYGWDQKKISFAKNKKLAETLLLQVNYKQELTEYSVDNTEHKKYAIRFRDSFDNKITNLELFEEISYSSKNPDFVLTIHYFNKRFTNMWLQFLTTITLFLFPSYEENDLEIRFEFQDKNKKPIKEYVRKVESKYFVQLFLLPVSPFLDHPDILKDTIESVFDEAIKDGVFKQ